MIDPAKYQPPTATPPGSEPQDQTSADQEQFEPQTNEYLDQPAEVAAQSQLEPEEALIVWEAPNRPYKKRDREYYTTIAIIVFLLSIILFFAGQFILIAVIISFAFVSYALASVPPENTTHAVTTYGLRTGDQLYYWGELGRFWFSDRLGQRTLNVEYFHRFIGRLVFLLGDVTEDEMKSVLSHYLRNETPLPTFVEKTANWLQKKFPLDKNG